MIIIIIKIITSIKIIIITIIIMMMMIILAIAFNHTKFCKNTSGKVHIRTLQTTYF